MSTETTQSYDPTIEWSNGWIAVWRKCEWFGFNVASIKSGLSDAVKLILLYWDNIIKGNSQKNEPEFVIKRRWFEKPLDVEWYLQETKTEQNRYLWENISDASIGSLVWSMRRAAMNALNTLKPAEIIK